jgi:hypothetical protein
MEKNENHDEEQDKNQSEVVVFRGFFQQSKLIFVL